MPDLADGTDLAQPDLAQPDLAQPDTVDVGTPDVVKPDGADASPDTEEVYVPLADLPEGVLGIPPADCNAIRTFEVKNDGVDRNREIAYSGIPLPRSLGVLDTKRLIVVDEKGAWVRAQFDILSRWGGTLTGNLAATRPVRWLHVALPVSVETKTTRTFTLRRCASDPTLPLSDTLEARVIDENDGTKTVETGVARFRLNPYNPAVIEWIEVDFDQTGKFTRVYTHRAGAGPTLRGPGSVMVQSLVAYTSLEDTDTVVVAKAPGTQDPDVKVVETGPVKVSLRVRGIFRHSSLKRDCTNNSVADPTDPFGYSAVLTFYRGSADVGLQFNFRNECGSLSQNGYLGDFTDEGAQIEGVNWYFPLEIGGTKLHGGLGTQLFSSDDGFAGVLVVEQGKGSIGQSGWQPSGTVILNPDVGPKQTLHETGMLLDPYVALSGPSYTAFAQIAYMPFREPMALAVGLDHIALRIVSQPLRVGEAKAIWSSARIAIRPAIPQVGLRIANSRLRAFLERGLMPRLPLSELNESKVFPSLGRDDVAPTTLKSTYTAAINKVHALTVGYPVDPNPSEPGQWKRAFTFGSQLWPDTQLFAPSELTITSPLDNVAYTNAADPIANELREYFRSGDPKFVWDFSLPQAYLMVYTAWYNTGGNFTWLNGFATNRGGEPTEGDWHRKSDKFTLGHTFNGGLADAYVLRPTPLLLDRFAQQYVATTFTHDKPIVQQGNRGWYQHVELLANFTSDDSYDPASGFALLQHLVALTDCAEFVPGDVAGLCREKLEELLAELVTDNVFDGLLCNGDEPTVGECRNASLFVYLEGFAAFVWRLGTMSSAHFDPLAKSVIRLSEIMLEHGVPRASNQIDVEGSWTRYYVCQKGVSTLGTCTGVTAANWPIFEDRKPQALALPLIAMQLGSLSSDPCPLLKVAFANGKLYGLWSKLFSTSSEGWLEGNASVMHSMIYGVGGLDLCN